MVLAAVATMSSTSSLKTNLNTVKSLIKRASQEGAKALFLPEATDFIAKSASESLQLSTQSHEFMEQVKVEAQKNSIFVSIALHESDHDREDPKRLFNTHYLINSEGSTIGKYRKIHLFDVDIQTGNDERVTILESRHTVKGQELVKPIQSPIGNIGLSICYDLRFPEQSLILRKLGADVITYPSAFTVPTGELGHWHTLLRARAIETQTYVIAAAQHGTHNDMRSSYGHALVVDPFGRIVAECANETGFLMVDIDLGLVEMARAQMPVFTHRRDDIYSLKLTR